MNHRITNEKFFGLLLLALSVLGSLRQVHDGRAPEVVKWEALSEQRARDCEYDGRPSETASYTQSRRSTSPSGTHKL